MKEYGERTLVFKAIVDGEKAKMELGLRNSSLSPMEIDRIKDNFHGEIDELFEKLEDNLYPIEDMRFIFGNLYDEYRTRYKNIKEWFDKH